MPSYQAHLYQAQHNEGLLSELLASLSYKDWLVTVAFYSAIHYVEAAFFNNPTIVHTDTCIPIDPNTGKWSHSPHNWRMKLLWDNSPEYVWRSFRSLYNESYIARYLLAPGRGGVAVTTDAQTHWTNAEARDFVDVDLINIKNGLGFS